MTNRSKTVIVATRTRTLVLSPDDVEGFIGATGVPSTGVNPGEEQQFHPGGAGGNLTGKFAAVSIVALALAVVLLAVVYSPGAPDYTPTADHLTIHDRFYPVTLQADATDADRIRIVDPAADPEWRPTLRTNGFANRNYQSGWFRVANGKTVCLYRAGGTRLVLIPPKGDGTFVLYQAKDPQSVRSGIKAAVGQTLRIG